MGAPAVASEPTPWAVVVQDELPTLRSREESARLKLAARQAFFRGEGDVASAFPQLAGADIGRASVVRGRLGLLDDAAVQRARELHKASAPAIDGTERQLAQYRQQVVATLDAEELADGAIRRVLTGLLAAYEDHPELRAEAVAIERKTLEEAKRKAQAEVDAAADEAETAAAQRRVALADADLQRFDEVVNGLRWASVGGVPPRPEPELVRLDGGAGRRQAALRLRLMEPFLPAEEAKRVAAAAAAFWDEERGEAESAVAEAQAAIDGLAQRTEWPDEAEAAEAVTRAEERLASRTALRDVLPTLEGADVRRAEALALRVQAAELQLQLAKAVAERAATADVEQSAERALTEAQAAQEEAERARAEADDARTRRIADAKGEYADAQSRGADLWSRARDAQQGVEEATARWAEKMAELDQQVDRVQNQSALDAERVDPDEVFRGVRTLLSELRDDPKVRGEGKLQAEDLVAESRAAVAEDRQRLAAARELSTSTKLTAAQREDLAATVQRWQTVLDDEERAAKELLDAVIQRRNIGLRTLQDARVARRTLSDYISRQARNDARSDLLRDFSQEVALLGPSVVMMARDRWDEIRHIGQFATDFNILRSVFMGSLSTMVLLFAWWWARAQVRSASLRVAQRVRQARPELRPADVHALRDPTERFLRNTVDLALGYSLIWSLGDTLPEIAFLLLVYLQLSLYRVLLAGFDLAVVRDDEVRPALLALRLEAWRLARRTVQVFASFFIVRSFLRFLVWQLLGLDTIHGLVEYLLSWAFWALVGWALWQWEPHLQERMKRYASGHRAIAWLATNQSPLLRIPRAIGSLGVFAVRGAVDLAYQGARDGTSLGWLFNFVNRYRLEDDASEEVRFLTEEARQQIFEGETLPKHRIERVEVTQGIVTTLNDWKRTRRRGLVALVGDRGAGKRTSMNEVEKLIASHDLEVVRARLDRRITGEAEAVAWLAEATACEGDPRSVEDLAAVLEDMPSRVYLFEGLHLAFARKVGGLDAIATILYVLNATSDNHFWVVSVHKPAWDWFDSVGSLVDTGVFRTIIPLAPLTSAQLQALTVARTGQAGYRVDFQGLVKASALGTDPKIELERSTSVFYRLLAEASSGNPSIAMRMWSRCLQPTDDDHLVTVRMGASLSAGVVPNLSDNALFVLVALRLQDELTVRELVEVTNLSTAAVRTTVRDLLSRQLVERCSGEQHSAVRIPDAALQSVARTLRRRHFLHLGAA